MCFACEKRKKVEEFSFRPPSKKVKRNGSCKKCVNAYHVRRRETDPTTKTKHRAYIRQTKQRLKEFVWGLKNKPCPDCKRKFKPWQMHFDHVRGEKLGNIGSMVTKGLKKKLLEEIKKCEIVCANCHAGRTYQRLQKNKGA